MKKDLYGVVGFPIRHSLSPIMQKAAFDHLGIDAEYRAFEIEPDKFENFLADMGKNSIAGLNVTIPHKISAYDYVREHGTIDETADRLGAVNTVKNVGGELKGFNTDGPGFYRSLVTDLKYEPEGKDVFILGAGGAATAIVMYLGEGPDRIFLFDTDTKKAQTLAERYRRYYDPEKITIVSEDGMKDAISDSTLFVNATPCGMKGADGLPIDKSYLHQGLYVYDLVYNMPVTPLVKEASMMKLHAVTGSGMLVYQGAVSFEIWTEQKAPVEIMKKALKKALQG